jgi:hypothetical protein
MAAPQHPAAPEPTGLPELRSIAKNLTRVADSQDSIARNLQRIADKLAPPPAAVVGSRYVADRLDCTTVWVAEMVRQAQIPKPCVVAGTGNGKPWKFHRAQIDKWIEER